MFDVELGGSEPSGEEVVVNNTESVKPNDREFIPVRERNIREIERILAGKLSLEEKTQVIDLVYKEADEFMMQAIGGDANLFNNVAKNATEDWRLLDELARVTARPESPEELAGKIRDSHPELEVIVDKDYRIKVRKTPTG